MKHISRSTKSYISPRSGFTLLEVLLVLMILGVIAAMVVPNLLGRQEEAYRKASGGKDPKKVDNATCKCDKGPGKKSGGMV